MKSAVSVRFDRGTENEIDGPRSFLGNQSMYAYLPDTLRLVGHWLQRLAQTSAALISALLFASCFQERLKSGSSLACRNGKASLPKGNVRQHVVTDAMMPESLKCKPHDCCR